MCHPTSGFIALLSTLTRCPLQTVLWLKSFRRGANLSRTFRLACSDYRYIFNGVGSVADCQSVCGTIVAFNAGSRTTAAVVAGAGIHLRISGMAAWAETSPH